MTQGVPQPGVPEAHGKLFPLLPFWNKQDGGTERKRNYLSHPGVGNGICPFPTSCHGANILSRGHLEGKNIHFTQYILLKSLGFTYTLYGGCGTWCVLASSSTPLDRFLSSDHPSSFCSLWVDLIPSFQKRQFSSKDIFGTIFGKGIVLGTEGDTKGWQEPSLGAHNLEWSRSQKSL